MSSTHYDKQSYFPSPLPVNLMQPAYSRYWIAIMLLVVTLSTITAFVLLAGSNAPLRTQTITPQTDTVSTRPVWRVTFEQPVDPASLRDTVVVSPTVPLRLQWVANTLEIQPQRALPSNIRVTLTIGPGVQTTNGVALQGTVTQQFLVRSPRIAYILSQNDVSSALWMSEEDGSKAEQVSASRQNVRDFDVLPDGSGLLYTTVESENTVALWQVTLEDKVVRRVRGEVGTIYESPRVGPLGDTVVVQLRRETQIADQGTRLGIPRLYLLTLEDNGDIRLLYGDGASVAYWPRWSPDGTQLALYDTDVGIIVVTDLVNPVTVFDAKGAYLGEQAWSPDGIFLTYTLPDLSDNNAPNTLVVHDVTTGYETMVVRPELTMKTPAFSPDGTQLAYSFEKVTGELRQGGIGLIRPNGTGQRVLVSEADTSFSQPLWSPGGSSILYGRFQRREGQLTQELWVMRYDGTAARQVAVTGLRQRWIP